MYTMKRLIFVVFFFVTTFFSYAQRIVIVSGDLDYVVPETQTPAEAKRIAVTQARLKAIADEFGTIVSQTNTATVHSAEGQTSTSFNSYTENEVRGVWIEDIHDPIVRVEYVNETMVVHVKVKGKAREMKNVPIELQVQTLSYGYHKGDENPTRKGYETTQFNNGEFFGVHFKSPINGYVAVFIRDEKTEIVTTLLPYSGSDGYAREIKSNMDYVFLTNEDPAYPYKTTTILETTCTIEYNTLIVVFSKNPFHISLTNQGKWFPEIELPIFQRWLHNLRNTDETAQVQEIVLTIKK